MAFALLTTSLLGATPAPAQTPCTSPPAAYPEGQLVSGTLGTGMTTLDGTTPTSFSFRILGVIPDGWMVGLDAVAFQITGPPSFIDRTGGVFYGMSGSPAYVGGKLAGAVSGVFYNDPTFGVLTPAQPMLDLLGTVGGTSSAQLARRIVPTSPIRRAIAEAEGVSASTVTGTFEQLPTPLAVSGLSDAQITELQTKLDERGENFKVYSAASAPASSGALNPVRFVPGEPLGAAIAYGDASYYATGTATISCGDYVVAFGHPFFYDAPGQISLGLSGAEGLLVLKGGSGWPGERYALLTEPRGQIVQDRLSGIVGVIGATPPSVPIVTNFTSPDSGISRIGTTEAVHTWGWWLEDIVWSHVVSNFTAVLQHYGGGTSSLDWTIAGTTEDGTPFTVQNRGMFYSEWDATEAVYKLVSTIDALQFNGFQDVTFTSITSDGTITKQQLEGEIVRVRTSSALQPALRSRNVSKVKAGRVLTVETTIAPVDGSSDIVTTMQIRIPSSAEGTKTMKLRGGKDSYWFRMRNSGSFDGLLAALEGGQHANDLILSGFGASQTTVLDWIPLNKMSFAVEAV